MEWEDGRFDGGSDFLDVYVCVRLFGRRKLEKKQSGPTSSLFSRIDGVMEVVRGVC